MKNIDLVKYIDAKVFNDKLWGKGKTFSLVNESGESFEIEEFGSYLNRHPDFGGKQDVKIYDDYVTDFVNFEGSRIKQFFRVDSSCFQELLDEKKNNPKCSYVTCVDGLLEDGYVPEKISAILMHCYPDKIEEENIEKFGARMLNHFEVPSMFCEKLTCFNTKNEPEIFSVAVDYLKPNEIMMNLNDYMKQYCNKLPKVWGLKNDIKDIIECYEEIFREHYSRVKKRFGLQEGFSLEDEIAQMKEDVAYASLVRKHGLGDGDLFARNMGVVINKETNKISVAPAYDFEAFVSHVETSLSFSFKYAYKYSKNFQVDPMKWILDYVSFNKDDGVTRKFIKDVTFMVNNYPNAVEKFVSKVNELVAGSEDEGCKLDCFLDGLYSNSSIAGDSYISEEDLELCKKDFKDNITMVRDVIEIFSGKDLQIEKE